MEVPAALTNEDQDEVLLLPERRRRRPVESGASLVDRSRRILDAEHFDRALDLPPAAEMDDIPYDPALVRARCGFDLRMLAEARDQLIRVRECGAIDGMDLVVQFPTLACLSGPSP